MTHENHHEKRPNRALNYYGTSAMTLSYRLTKCNVPLTSEVRKYGNVRIQTTAEQQNIRHGWCVLEISVVTPTNHHARPHVGILLGIRDCKTNKLFRKRLQWRENYYERLTKCSNVPEASLMPVSEAPSRLQLQRYAKKDKCKTAGQAHARYEGTIRLLMVTESQIDPNWHQVLLISGWTTISLKYTDDAAWWWRRATNLIYSVTPTQGQKKENAQCHEHGFRANDNKWIRQHYRRTIKLTELHSYWYLQARRLL